MYLMFGYFKTDHNNGGHSLTSRSERNNIIMILFSDPCMADENLVPT